MAEALAAEWQQAGGEQGGEMDFDDVPLTRLAGTAQERIARRPGAGAIEALARYGESDLLCYRAEGPVALVERQDRAWQPWLDWARMRTLARALRITTGDRLRAAGPGGAGGAADGRWPDTIRSRWPALGIAVPALGSLVLGLALARMRAFGGRGDGARDAGRDVPGGAVGQ